jgi:hypothetical protein
LFGTFDDVTVICDASTNNRLDLNNNGLQDASEPGIAGVTVQLCVANTACTMGSGLVETTTTSASGIYLFNSLDAGAMNFLPNTQYTIQMAYNTGPLLGTQAGKSLQGSDRTVDSNGMLCARAQRAHNRVRAGVVNMAGTLVQANVLAGGDGSVDVSIDFAFVIEEVGDFVWEDLNGDGLQGASEPGIANVIVQLRDMTGTNVLATTNTSATGYYYFTSLGQLINPLVPSTKFVIYIDLNQVRVRSV